MAKIAVIGAGLVGRAWSVVFARAGKNVFIYDNDTETLHSCIHLISLTVNDLFNQGLLDESPKELLARIDATNNISRAIENADYVQESGPENLHTKIKIFEEIDSIANPLVPIGSSTSGFIASSFTKTLIHKERCLVVHPVNPPSVIPLVEIAPAPWTKKEIIDRVKNLMVEIGQEPIVLLKEIDGFILNRLQGALLNESLRLISDGFISTEDLDKTVKYGLGLRWSFMGPIETIDINAPSGIEDYASRYGPIYYQVAKDSDARPWDEKLIARASKERRSVLPMEQHLSRQQWRDKRLMALIRHKKDASKKFGD